MALQRPFDHDGQHYPEAYTRITSITVDVETTGVYAVTFPDRASRDRGDFPMYAEQHFAQTASLDGPIYPAAYAFLKTQPGFEQAIDVNPDEFVN